MNRTRSFRQIWSVPIALAILSAMGLTSALIGDGLWDVLSWIALGAPIGAVGWALAQVRFLLPRASSK